MGKPDNPFTPGTIPYRILEGDGKWDNMSTKEIAQELGCAKSTVHYGFDCIKYRLNYTVKRRNRSRRPVASQNGNIYRINSKLWKLYEGDWSEKTESEIAEELGTTRNVIGRYIWQISRETGKYIHFLDGRKARSGRIK